MKLKMSSKLTGYSGATFEKKLPHFEIELQARFVGNDYEKFKKKLRKRGISTKFLICARDVNPYPSKIKIVDNIAWNMDWEFPPIVTDYFKTTFNFQKNLEALEEIKDKEWVSFDYINHQFTMNIKRLKEIPDETRILNKDQVFFYYQVGEKMYPKKIPMQGSGKGYYVVLKRHEICRGIAKISLYDHKDRIIKEF